MLMKSSHAPATAETDASSPAAAPAAIEDVQAAAASGSFSERIRLLIQRVGSATEIARMCGFSEGVVRSWRDGNSDPSRARCVTLAKTLGVSLVWLVAGEGAIQTDNRPAPEEPVRAEVRRHSREGKSGTTAPASTQAPLRRHMVDATRLDVAKRILQSGLALSGAVLSPSDHADMLVTLYEIVGPGGTQIDTDALLAFNQRLAAQLHPQPDRLIG